MNKLYSLLSIPAVIAAISGITMAIQGTLNSQLYQKTSILAATFVVHVIGVILAFAAVLVTRTPLMEYSWLSIPWYLYLGGVLSVIIIGLVAFSIPKIGVANATTAIIIGQVGLLLSSIILGYLVPNEFLGVPGKFLALSSLLPVLNYFSNKSAIK